MFAKAPLKAQYLLAKISRLNEFIQALIGHADRVGAYELEKTLQENQKINRDLKESESLFRLMFEYHSAVMLLIEPQSGLIVEANTAATQFYGFPIEQLRGMNVNRLNMQPESVIQDQRQQVLRGEINKLIFDHRLANGEVRTVEGLISPIHLKNVPLLFVIINDITERKHSEEQMRSFAFHDMLTNLPNRRLLSDRLNQVMAINKRNGCHAALMILDLDNFKLLNDKHGHNAGDILLVEVAKRLKGCVREVDTVARFGGDEFVILLGELDKKKELSMAQARIVAEKIRGSISKPYTLAYKQDTGVETSIQFSCTSSIGLVLFGNTDTTQEEIFRSADAAMYKAKENGQNLINCSEI